MIIKTQMMSLVVHYKWHGSIKAVKGNAGVNMINTVSTIQPTHYFVYSSDSNEDIDVEAESPKRTKVLYSITLLLNKFVVIERRNNIKWPTITYSNIY